MDVITLLDHYGLQALILAVLLYLLLGRGLAALEERIPKRKRKPKGEARGTAFRLRR